MRFDIEKAVARVAQRTGKQLLTVGPIADDLHKFRMVTARGTPRELGHALGMIGIERGYPFPAVPAQQRERNTSIVALYQEIDPAYLERVAGLAEAYGRKIEDVDLAVTEAFYFSQMGADGYGMHKPEETAFPECSIVATHASAGRTVVGRNLDTTNETRFLERSEVQGSYKSLNTGMLAFHEYVLDGINEKGLFIGEMSIVDATFGTNYWRDYPMTPSVYSFHMMRVVLDTCASVEQAVALFKRVPVWFLRDLWHFFLADASGDFALVEWSRDRELAVTRQHGGALVSANTSLIEGREKLMKEWRYAFADKYIAEKGADGIATHTSMAELMKRMSFRADNPVVPIIIGTMATVWTSTYDLTDRTMVIRYWEDGYKEHSLGF